MPRKEKDVHAKVPIAKCSGNSLVPLLPNWQRSYVCHIFGWTPLRKHGLEDGCGMVCRKKSN